MTEQTPVISPLLKQGATKRNIDAARKAVSVALYNGWVLVGPYNGSDTRSHWECKLGGPKCVVIEKFYSHIRGRKDAEGNWKPSPRHKDCLPAVEREAALTDWRKRNGLTEEWFEGILTS
ncbi:MULTISPECIES: hypothetical protein [unclassified Streptomyces]|uniref:hypothetical protein n=1 Tax=unclassified Streptomyces TaxID=2593676 RepID=UPI0035DF17E4